MAHEIEIYPSRDGYRFRVKGGNGEIVATSEAYTSKANAQRGTRTLVSGLSAMPTALTLVEAEEAPDQVRDAGAGIVDAWENSGDPAVRKRVKNYLRSMWPALHAAVEEYVRITADGARHVAPPPPAQIAGRIADLMDEVIHRGDVAEVAAPVEGESGRSEAVSARDSLLEDPSGWLRSNAEEIGAL